MNLGNKLLELRKNSNFSQEELAEKLGTVKQEISEWESNESSPNLEQAKKLSIIYKISLDELVNNDISGTIKKRSNTKKSSQLTIKINKLIGFLILIAILLSTICFLFKPIKEWLIEEEKQCQCSTGEGLYNMKIFDEEGAKLNILSPSKITVKEKTDNYIIIESSMGFAEYSKEGTLSLLNPSKEIKINKGEVKKVTLPLTDYFDNIIITY